MAAPSIQYGPVLAWTCQLGQQRTLQLMLASPGPVLDLPAQPTPPCPAPLQTHCPSRRRPCSRRSGQCCTWSPGSIFWIHPGSAPCRGLGSNGSKACPGCTRTWGRPGRGCTHRCCRRHLQVAGVSSGRRLALSAGRMRAHTSYVPSAAGITPAQWLTPAPHACAQVWLHARARPAFAGGRVGNRHAAGGRAVLVAVQHAVAAAHRRPVLQGQGSGKALVSCLSRGGYCCPGTWCSQPACRTKGRLGPHFLVFSTHHQARLLAGLRARQPSQEQECHPQRRPHPWIALAQRDNLDLCSWTKQRAGKGSTPSICYQGPVLMDPCHLPSHTGNPAVKQHTCPNSPNPCANANTGVAW